ncbi:MAG: pro-sigmaK processing inhibitor BofA family protein [Bacillota bacterium]|jgi:inhibitor of the pro-sigma K processing machinery|nr:pro-sigmaK processing inhibitor BofA family protein [Bacillota bacterium]
MTGTILGVLFGLFLLFLVGQALWGPLRLLLRMGLRFLLGGAVLYLFNLIAGTWGWSFGINPLSAFAVGLLGFPGFLLLGALKICFGF